MDSFGASEFIEIEIKFKKPAPYKDHMHTQSETIWPLNTNCLMNKYCALIAFSVCQLAGLCLINNSLTKFLAKTTSSQFVNSRLLPFFFFF